MVFLDVNELLNKLNLKYCWQEGTAILQSVESNGNYVQKINLSFYCSMLSIVKLKAVKINTLNLTQHKFYGLFDLLPSFI